MNKTQTEELNKARWLMYYNQHDAASEKLQQVISTTQTKAEPHYLLAYLYFLKKAPAHSLQHLNIAQKLEPDQPKCLQLIYHCYNMLGKDKEAEETAIYLAGIEKEADTIFQTRRYLRPEFSLSEVFEAWNVQKINYVVLRWFDLYPEIAPGEDVDMLIYDDDLPRIKPWFTSVPLSGSIPFDVYSNSGVPGSAYENLPYYPKHLANKILSNKLLHNDLFYIPSPEDHFHSLAYHALYHKDYSSALPVSSEEPPKAINKKHDYTAALTELAKKNSVDVEINMQGLHSYLSDIGWIPGTDLMRKLGLYRNWVRSVAPPPTNMQETGSAETGVFIIREWATKPEIFESIKQQLSDYGFEIILEQELTGKTKDKASYYIRSGNWNRDATGIFKELNSGGPAIMLVVVDMHPMPLSDGYGISHPYVTNDRFRCKELIRKNIVTRFLEPGKTTNPLHSADDELEAWEYINLCIPEKTNDIITEVQAKHKRLESKYPVKKLLHFGGRGKVELIDYNGQPAVKKTFRDHSLEFLEGELLAAETLSKEVTMFPALLEKGDNYLITPYYQDLFEGNEPLRQKVLTKEAKTIGTLYRYFFDKGLMHLDIHPNNFILCKKNGLFLVDFEYLQAYKNKPDHISESYDVKGIPDNFDGRQPMNHILADADTYDYQKLLNSMWYQTTGYTIAGLVLKSLE